MVAVLKECLLLLLPLSCGFYHIPLQKAAKPARDHSGISVMRRYSGQLCLLKARFSSDRDLSPLPLEFRW